MPGYDDAPPPNRHPHAGQPHPQQQWQQPSRPPQIRQPDPYGPPAGYQPPAYAAAPEPQKRKRKKWPFVLLAFVVLSIAGFVSCTAAVGSAVNTASAPVSVRYELTGDGGATTVTYSTGSGTSQESKAKLPWTKSIQFDNGLLAATVLTAQNAGDGNISCKIVNEATGATIAESTSSGQYAVVSCSGTA